MTEKKDEAMTPRAEKRRAAEAAKAAKKRRDATILLGIIALAVLVSVIPQVYYLVYRARAEEEQLATLAGDIVGDVTLLMSMVYEMVDKQAVQTAKFVKSEYETKQLSVAELSSLFAAQLEQDGVVHDILLVEPDGYVLASGRTDSPSSISGIVDPLPSFPDDVFRASAFGGHPYGNYVLPYVVGIGPKEDGSYRHGLVVLVAAEFFSHGMGTSLLVEETDIIIVDSSGCVIFRYPKSGEFGSLTKGDRLPLDVWDRIFDTPAKRRTVTMMEKHGEAYSGFANIPDAADVRIGTVLTTINATELSRYVVDKDRWDERLYPFVLAGATLTSAFLVVYAIRRRLRDMADEEAALLVPFDNDDESLAQTFERDFVTGALNRRRGEHVLDEAIERADADGGPVAVIYTDLDRFKQINKSFGANVGDTLLREAALIFEGSVGDGDRICRWGGDEFIIILPGRTTADAEAIWGTIEEQFELIALPEMSLEISASHGVAEYDHNDPKSAIELVEAARMRSLPTGA